ESMRWPSMTTVSCTADIAILPSAQLQARQREPLLRLVLSLLVRVRRLADLVALEEQALGDALVRVDLRGKRRRVRDLEGHDALPLRLERRDVHDDAAARIAGFAHANCDHAPGDPEVLHGAGERERVRGDDADVALEVHEGARVEVLGVDDRGV